MRLLAPRSLKEPIGCRVSSLRYISAGASSTFSRTRGVRNTVPVMRSRAARICSMAGGVNSPLTRPIDLHLGLDLDRNTEGELGEADRGAGVLAPIGTVDLQDEIGEAV